MNKTTAVSHALLETIQIEGRSVDVLRLDRHHGQAPGNKWFKLNHNLGDARQLSARTLASFGGAWSNHLHALAIIAAETGFASVGWVRADGLETAMLQDAQQAGMQLVFLSRSEYRRRHDPGFVAELLGDIDAPFYIPEGGGNLAGVQGCGDILKLLPNAGADYDEIMLACGTGTTLAGLVAAYQGRGCITGVPVLKAEKFMAAEVNKLLAQLPVSSCQWRLDHRFHCGGYAKLPDYLRCFIQQFESKQSIPLEPVYTAKVFYAAQQRIRAGEFAPEEKLLLIHTGGLQGRRGFPDLYPDLYSDLYNGG
ncbi:1-aminocyclopropane-1-carboxylate deaminase/D-cysteine desulfhydrase [Spongiibacter sp. IMCC21906]|uniref:1-aminocyclopropane-1-carboxylate deaminase/D-cysteine desulfhydrase n=1 Tax=Spongiibacter sp. IMCC21906 TaxID=1620392 RepID=UPI00062E805D|nr:pyridoxal-phosphate dependent enzyme [Spongiibacter sp. IMCC21906]